MVEVGSLEIAGTLNAESIKQGLSEVKRGLDEAKESAKSAFGDMSRLGDTVKSMAGPLAAIGSAAAGALMGVATMAPQVAPHLERMKAQFFRLATTVGEVFEPSFKQAADTFEGFISWLNSPGGQGVLRTVRGIMEGFSEGLVDAVNSLNKISKDWSIGLDIDVGEGVKWVANKLGPEIAATIVGYKFGGSAGAAMAGGGTAITRGITGEGKKGQTALSAVKTIGGLTATGAGIGSISPDPITTAIGAGAGAVAGTAFEANKALENSGLPGPLKTALRTSIPLLGAVEGGQNIWGLTQEGEKNNQPEKQPSYPGNFTKGGVNEEEQFLQQYYKNANKTGP